MDSSKPTFATVSDYIASFPPDVRAKLNQLRDTIRKAAPKAEEMISYGMAAFKQEGYVAYFAGYKSHIGFYPRPAEFKKELEKYEGGKGTIKFRLDEPIPVKLVTQMVKFRVVQNMDKAKAKRIKNKE
jgi:uncharacterized protein YdhG (YjbR/CyaY superfamily)